MQHNDFMNTKKTALHTLAQAINKHEVDKTIIPILRAINIQPDYYTTSSCSGRIMILELPSIGDKKHARIIKKWHNTIKPAQILSALDNTSEGIIWFLAQSPIIHTTCDNYSAANILIKHAVAAGFKNSGMKAHGKYFHVEIVSTERIDAPIGENKTVFVSPDYFNLLVKIANEVITKSTSKLNRLHKIIIAL